MAQEDYRERCLNEIVQTEASYVECLRLLVEEYVKPSRARGVLAEKHIVSLFSNVELLYAFNVELLAELKGRRDRRSDPVCVGDIFVRLFPMLRMYRDFVKNFPDSLETMKHCEQQHQEWADFVEGVDGKLTSRQQDSMQLSLSSLLIMPVQRIPRYSLLIKDLLKHTPASHPDRENLMKAQELIDGIAASMNEYLKEAENRNKLWTIDKSMIGMKRSLLEPHRRFVREGTLKKITTRLVRTCHLFLFNDVLVYAHVQILHNYQYKGTIQLGTSWIRDLEDTTKYQNVFQLVGQLKTWTFLAESLEQKRQWIDDIEAQIDELVRLNPALTAQRGQPVTKRDSLLSLWTIPASDFDSVAADQAQRAKEERKAAAARAKAERASRRSGRYKALNDDEDEEGSDTADGSLLRGRKRRREESDSDTGPMAKLRRCCPCCSIL